MDGFVFIVVREWGYDLDKKGHMVLGIVYISSSKEKNHCIRSRVKLVEFGMSRTRKRGIGRD